MNAHYGHVLSFILIFASPTAGQQNATLLEELLTGAAKPSLKEVAVPYYIPAARSEQLPLEKAKFQAKVSGGVITALINGERASLRIEESRPQFLVKLNVAPREERDVVLLLERAVGRRAAVMAIKPGGLTQPMPGKYMGLEYQEVGEKHYLLRPASSFKPGEYCLTFGDPNLTYCFGINEGAQESPDPVSTTAASAPSGGDDNPRLVKLKSLLDKGLITKDDFDKRMKEISQPEVEPSLADRLKRLDALLKQGLITKSEYEKKRAELLSEI